MNGIAGVLASLLVALLVAGLATTAAASGGDDSFSQRLAAIRPIVEPGPPGSSLRRIQDAGVLRWGVDPAGGAPFAMPDPVDPRRLAGFEVELMEMLSAYLGVRSEPVPGDWLALVDNMQAGRTDFVLNGLEITDERADVVDFTTPYYAYAQQLTVRDADRERFRSLDDLRGRRVSVLNGSASVDVLLEAGWAEENILQYDDSLNPYRELALGRCDASLAESIIASYYAPQVRGPEGGLHCIPETFAPGRYGGAVRKGEPELLAAVDRVLEHMKASGDIGMIDQRWGIWNDGQAAIGVVRGPDVAVVEVASGTTARAIDWGLVFRQLLRATGITMLLTAASMPLAVVAGLGLALLAGSRHRWLSWPAVAYIQVVRGTPLLVQIFLVYFSLPVLGAWLGFGQLLTLGNITVGVICLAGNYAAYEAEIHRAGLQAVPRGQREAALSLGMSERQAFWFVVLPQSLRIVMPPMVNDLVAMIKDTSLVYVIGVQELTAVALGIGKARFAVPEMLVIAAILYLVVSLAADQVGRRLEARLRRRGEGRATLGKGGMAR